MVSRMTISTLFSPTFSLSSAARDGLLPVLVFSLALLADIKTIILLFVIVGQAHFFMAFLYQYKGKKMNRRYLGVAAVLLILASIYFIYIGLLIPVFLVTSIAFGLHFAMDEFYLHGEKNGPNTFVSLLGFMLLYSSIVFQILGPGYGLLPVFAGVFVFAHVVVRIFRRKPFSGAERYLLFVGCLTLILGAGLQLWITIPGIISLLHCFNWVIGYAQRVQGHAAARFSYWKNTLATLALSIGLYSLWIITDAPILAFLFLPLYWYAWALAHFVLSSPLVVGTKKPLV